jgi:SecD/SecF fusion protein
MYPGNKEEQLLYKDSVNDAQKAYLKHLLDSTKDTKLFFGLTTYAASKGKRINVRS